MKIGFDNEKYLQMQSSHIRERINQFDNKLYLEFGGKLFDDYHASRVLPGFQPDSKLHLLKELSDTAEIVIVISAADIEANKVRGDLGITYDTDVLRLKDEFEANGLFVGSVVITQYSGQNSADLFKGRLEKLGIKVYIHYVIEGYPSNIPLIVSDEGYGRNEYIETSRPLVVITAPGPGSGKMATCLSQLYHEHKRGVRAGYAKFETFPIWNIPLKHPVNLAYEAATADLNDVNMIDPFHLEAYGVTTVNYNRDVEIFPVLSAIFERIYGENPYKSPTDMGVNMAGNCIVDDEVCCEASQQEILRRYYKCLCDKKRNGETKDDIMKKIVELKIEKNTILLENIKNVNEYMQAFDLFLFPSLYEGLGIVLIEAQAAGLKCFASDTIPKNAKISDNLIFVSLLSSSKQWANIMKDNIDYKRLNMLNIVKSNNFDRNSIMKNMEEIYG